MKNTKWIVMVIVGFLILGGMLGAYFMVPKVMINKALNKFEKYKSFKVEYLASDNNPGKIKLEAEINTNGKDLSKVVFGIGESVKVEALVSTSSAYLHLSSSEIESAEKSLKMVYPFVLQLETYKMARPVLLGERYLHINVPEATKSAGEVDKELVLAWEQIYTLRGVNPFYKNQGEMQTKIILGINKEKLLRAIEKIKDSNFDVKVSQINAIKKVVEETKDWDKDLIEIVIDRDGNLRSVVGRMPQPPKESLSKNLKDGVPSDNKAVSLGLEQVIAKYSQSAKLMELGEVRLDNFDEEVKVAIPEKLVEIDELMEIGQKELMPIVMSMYAKNSKTLR